MNFVIEAIICFLIGTGVGWYLKGKFGTTVSTDKATVVDVARKVGL